MPRRFIYISMIMMILPSMLLGASYAFSKNNQNEIIMQKIRQHIEQHMPYPPENVRIEFLSGLPKTEFLKEKMDCRIESRTTEEYIGDTSFNIRILANDVFLKEESVRVRIEVLWEFVVSRNSIPRGQVISMNDLAVQKKWVRRIPGNIVASSDDVIGKTIIVNIRPNTQITRSMLRDVMPVKKGKMVQVILDNGVMRMLMNGLAEEDGVEDSMVKVRNLSSNKIFHARVIGPSKVQIDF